MRVAYLDSSVLLRVVFEESQMIGLKGLVRN
jgi:hypothetical protein